MKTLEKLEKLESDYAELQKINSTLNETINTLTEQLEWFRRQIFGSRSEKIAANLNVEQLEFEGFETLKEVPKQNQVVKSHEKRKPNRHGKDKITLPSDLPVERVFLDLSKEEKTCPKTGVALIQIGEEISRKLANKPGSYYIKEIVRPKYANPNDSEFGIKTADLPSSLLERCQADDSLLADILVKKYADHQPLNRISEILGREDIFISRQLMSQWVQKCAEALKPLYNEMRRQVLASENVFIDEIPVKKLDPGLGRTKHSYMWVLCGGKERDPPYRIYDYRSNRRHHNATEILQDFRGVVHSDKYGAYETLATKKLFTWCPCWAHIRRKFIEVEHGDQDFCKEVLSKISKLFQLEETAWEESPDERLRMRQELEIPIIDSLTILIKDRLIRGKVLPKSNFKEALGYYCSLIPYLKNYTSHPWARLDNNVAERAVRPIALGRKNWLFLGNDRGGESAAIILSLVQTCRAVGVNPRIYLESVMSQLMEYNHQKISDLLPDNWQKSFKLI